MRTVFVGCYLPQNTTGVENTFYFLDNIRILNVIYLLVLVVVQYILRKSWKRLNIIFVN